MAWLNTFLSMFAFILGFWILITYPWYRDIDESIEIILTPLSLVFVLEIDNWMFEIAKQCYPETRMDKLWTFKSSIFREKPYIQRVSEAGNAVAILYYILINICLYLVVATITTEIRVEVISGRRALGLIQPIAINLCFIGIFLTIQGCACCFRFRAKCVGACEMVYDKTDEKLEHWEVENKIEIEDDTKELHIGMIQKSKSTEYLSIEREDSEQILDEAMNEVLSGKESVTNQRESSANNEKNDGTPV